MNDNKYIIMYIDSNSISSNIDLFVDIAWATQPIRDYKYVAYFMFLCYIRMSSII